MNPPNVSPTIELTNERLLLRMPSDGDVDALFAAIEESIDELGSMDAVVCRGLQA